MPGVPELRQSALALYAVSGHTKRQVSTYGTGVCTTSTPEQNRPTEIGSDLQHPSFEQQQRRRMLVALGVLLLALIAVVIKDRQYWFPPSPVAEPERPEQVPSSNPPVVATPKTATQIPASKIRAEHDARSKSKPLSKTARAAPPQNDPPFIVATNRAVLPPLEVEVV